MLSITSSTHGLDREAPSYGDNVDMEAFLKACFHDLIEGIGPGPEGSRLTLNNYRSWGSGVEDRPRTIGGYAMQRLFGVSATLFMQITIKRKVLNIDDTI